MVSRPYLGRMQRESSLADYIGVAPDYVYLAVNNDIQVDCIAIFDDDIKGPAIYLPLRWNYHFVIPTWSDYTWIRN